MLDAFPGYAIHVRMGFVCVWCALLCAPLGCEVRLHLFPACVVRLLPDVGCGARLWLLFAFCVACVRMEVASPHLLVMSHGFKKEIYDS